MKCGSRRTIVDEVGGGMLLAAHAWRPLHDELEQGFLIPDCHFLFAYFGNPSANLVRPVVQFEGSQPGVLDGVSAFHGAGTVAPMEWGVISPATFQSYEATV